ncbi:NADP-dependent oxidoreductase [Nafulsella turpanensis]|uniref:NADP-dependent oxidoreductase n=1 Tax=Nafulsella turpanensis TaxID=1265690 RepID=UPI0003470BDA|nr:NADP-dependent oxidoreductase [Nafulsella turpanensis]
MKQIVLASRPKGEPTKDNFRFEDLELPALREGEVLLQPLFMSVDPYMRGRMNEGKSYVAPYEVGQPIDGGVIARVVESRSNELAEGDTVLGTLPWAEKSIEQARKLRKVDPQLAPVSWYLGILGMPGLTAYFGLLDIGQPKEGETVVVSGAAGAVGTVVGQIARIKGCRVVGIAGTDEKVELLKKEFGYDEVINYKTVGDMGQALKTACPDGVDVYFDNVGGDITDAVIARINFHARIVLCGQIALYNETRVPVGPRFLPLILTRSALIKGFIVSNYSKRWPEGIQQLASWIKEGRLHYKETKIKGFEKLPEAFLGLFEGKNQGKMLIEV